jgi:hypothetical protein
LKILPVPSHSPTLIEAAPRSSGEWTSISGALTFGALQFEKNQHIE